MKDFLETLEIGENKVKLSNEDIKNILKKHGEYIKIETDKVEGQYKTQIEDNKTTIQDLKNQIEKSPKTDEMESLKNKIADYEKKETDRIAREQAQKQDEVLVNNINLAFGDKKFVNDFTKNAIVDQIKTALKDSANAGKSAKDLFEEITNGKEGIFANPNQLQNMPGVSENVDNTITKEAFDKMGYKERIELKNSNPELFKKYNE